VLGWFYLTVLPDWLGLDTQGFEVGLWEVARTVLIFLGIPLVAGFLTRRIGLRRKGRDWYDSQFVPRIAPVTLYGLLFTIVLLFALQGETITAEPLDAARIAVPLLVYFAGMWTAGFVAGRQLRLTYPKTATLAFTVASNDFELAIAVAVGVFGATSGQALAGVVGPLIEVPVLVSLVYVGGLAEPAACLAARREPSAALARRGVGRGHRRGGGPRRSGGLTARRGSPTVSASATVAA
jgi:ACR3 family arsenite transporter